MRTTHGVCTRCGIDKPAAEFDTRSDGYRCRVCRECSRARVEAREAKRTRNKVRTVNGREEKFCNECRRWLPKDADHFYRDRRPDRPDKFVGACRVCKVAAQAARRAAILADPERAAAYHEAQRQSRRKWAQKNPERLAEMKNDWRRRAMQNPAYRRRRNESQRMAYRLRREREGLPLPAPVMKAPKIVSTPVLSVGPIVDAITREIERRLSWPSTDPRSNVMQVVCRDYGVDERQYRAWRDGEILSAQFDTVDRILITADLHWWEVFDPDRWPNEAADAEQAFEGAMAA